MAEQQQGGLFGVLDADVEHGDKVSHNARMLALEDAARLCTRLGHPHAASEIRRQLIKGEGGDHAE